MADTLQRIFLIPPIAIARLGGSTSPQDAYRWVESPNPRSSGETTIQPDWSLVVASGGTVEPVMPTSLSLRDGALIRPVCPFLELWASVGTASSNPSTWKDVPVTPSLLDKQGISLHDLVITIDAKNFKVSRRTGNNDLQFGTFPPLEVRGDQHTPVAILAVSPPSVAASRRMIPPGQNIPLGAFQVIKSKPQPAPDQNLEWTKIDDGSPAVNVELLRFRFTPARGHFYGPPTSASPLPSGDGSSIPPVDTSGRAFLRSNAGWAGVDVSNNAPDAPSDTYDGADVNATRNPSYGVVDDTCEARIDVSIPLPAPGKQVLTASANVFVGPPDFAPDRRPFVSLADEVNDRSADGTARTTQMSNAERDAWVEDLFERIYETLSLFNLDLWRREKAINLTGTRLAPKSIPADQTSQPTRAMGGSDVLRNPDFALAGINQNTRLPLTKHARDRHRSLSDIEALRDFVAQHPGRLAELIRSSFEAERGETSGGIGITTMRMPPFMRNSNAGPLTLTAWQYELLMSWVKAVESARVLTAVPARVAKRVRPMSDAAIRRRAEVLARLERTSSPRGH